MHLNKPLMVFSLQGDRVIGVSGFNGMAEECIIDQKVSLALNMSAWRLFFSFLFFNLHLALSLLPFSPPSLYLCLSQALLPFKC